MSKHNWKYPSITKNWGGNKIRSQFDHQIDTWINQFDESEQDDILLLLNHFIYYTNRKMINSAKQLYALLTESANFTSKEKTVFIPVYKEYGVGFSDGFFTLFWMHNGLYDYSEKNIYSLLDNGNIFDSIIIVDDYSGSGDTIIETLKKCISLNENCKNAHFFVLTMEMSKTAHKHITDFSENIKINLTLISLHFTDKVFDSNYIFNDNIAKKKETYLNVCNKYNVTPCNIWGYKETQDLIAFEYNTPNNTLGLFWHEKDNFISIFKRHKKENTTLRNMQKDANRRKKQQQSDIIKKHDENEKYIYLMVYLVNKDMDFNYDDACKYFGITNEQMDTALNYLFDEKYVKIEKGHFKPTPLLKEYIKVTRIQELQTLDSQDDTLSSTNTQYTPLNFSKEFSGYKKR